MNDTALKQNVVDELEFEPMINATHIGVAVESRGVARGALEKPLLSRRSAPCGQR